MITPSLTQLHKPEFHPTALGKRSTRREKSRAHRVGTSQPGGSEAGSSPSLPASPAPPGAMRRGGTGTLQGAAPGRSGEGHTGCLCSQSEEACNWLNYILFPSKGRSHPSPRTYGLTFPEDAFSNSRECWAEALGGSRVILWGPGPPPPACFADDQPAARRRRSGSAGSPAFCLS